MPYTLSEIIVLFFTYSVVGWLWETVYCSIKDGHYDYRGFLFGPYCPVYGFAITTILICTDRFQDNIFLLFIVGMLVATIFEFVASVFLQKVFHMTLWDYSHLWGNIQGRIAPEISLFWGIGVVILVKFVQPFIQKIINWEEAKTHGAMAAIIVVVMGTDLVLTIISVKRFHATTQMWNEKINAHLNKLHAKLDQATDNSAIRHKLDNWHEDVIKHIDKIRPKQELSWNQRRLLKSFSKIKFDDAKHFSDLKQDLMKHGLLK
ncbi:putative ABC transporter permease [Lactobacillus sp.]|uniref:putative ABC transporter permease n=1 Tax=Lactobacillus sp. TaxID=1591 RepID=UPI0019AFDEB7|nr:putative ABC transporter permease [Lactobacillus sp.]MBD5429146.1 putative ABC transporter permease [Lactobacillus sp.]